MSISENHPPFPQFLCLFIVSMPQLAQISQQSGKLVAACRVVELGRVAYICSTKTLVSLASRRANAKLGGTWGHGYPVNQATNWAMNRALNWAMNRATNRASGLQIVLRICESSCEPSFRASCEPNLLHSSHCISLGQDKLICPLCIQATSIQAWYCMQCVIICMQLSVFKLETALSFTIHSFLILYQSWN